MSHRLLWILGFALAGCASDHPTCSESIPSFCATTSLPCPKTWTAAQDPASWGGCVGRNANSNPLLLKHCQNVDVVEMWGVDASTNYYYESSSGQLVTISSHQVIRAMDRCIAGHGIEPCDDPAPVDLCP
jgi:hypothetical protein